MTCGGSHLGFPIGIQNLYVLCSDMKFKMAAMAGLSLTLDPMGNMFQNASSLKPLGRLKPNCPGMIIGRSSVFYADRKSKMAATTGHSNNIGKKKICVFTVTRPTLFFSRRP
jgi:hypothetical protein